MCPQRERVTVDGLLNIGAGKYKDGSGNPSPVDAPKVGAKVYDRVSAEERIELLKNGVDISGESSIIESQGKIAIENAFKMAFDVSAISTDIVDAVINNHKSLAYYTPSSMKVMLENLGFDVKPLGGKSGLKDVAFENGGGYRITFKNDGYFQYHPGKNSHHETAYWKITNGERGAHRYDMEGNEKN